MQGFLRIRADCDPETMTLAGSGSRGAALGWSVSSAGNDDESVAVGPFSGGV